ncbi:MAG TPA: hypothetical protein VJB59_04455 [Bdellovibrionota bacterium]|nr:hypothetical protein [Bdellovibrionota bacterium]
MKNLSLISSLSRILAIVLLITTSSCGKDELTAAIETLVGNWSTGCIVGESSTSYKIVQTFTGTTLTGTTYYYSGTTCAVPIYESQSTGTLVKGALSSNVSGAVNYDFTWTSVTITSKLDAYTTQLNNMVNGGGAGVTGYCAYTDWATNVAKDVSARNCAGVTMRTVGNTHYDIVKITGSTLQFGAVNATYDGTTADKRPIALDSTYTYTKQ